MNSQPGPIPTWHGGPTLATEIHQCMARFAEETRRQRSQLCHMDHSESTMTAVERHSDSEVLSIREDCVRVPGVAHMFGEIETELSTSMIERMDTFLHSIECLTSSYVPTRMMASRDLPFSNTRVDSLQAMSMEALYDLVFAEPWCMSLESLPSSSVPSPDSANAVEQVTATAVTLHVEAPDMPMRAEINNVELALLASDQSLTANVRSCGSGGIADEEPALVHEPVALPNVDAASPGIEAVVPPPPPPPPPLVAMVPTTNERDFNDNDVLLGRGGLANHHPGNRRFLEQKHRLQPLYGHATRHQKTDIARALVHWVHREQNGRFMAKDRRTGRWNEVPLRRAREKASQALREGSTYFPRNVEAYQVRG
jgi:hypothetical protein